MTACWSRFGIAATGLPSRAGAGVHTNRDASRPSKLRKHAAAQRRSGDAAQHGTSGCRDRIAARALAPSCRARTVPQTVHHEILRSGRQTAVADEPDRYRRRRSRSVRRRTINAYASVCTFHPNCARAVQRRDEYQYRAEIDVRRSPALNAAESGSIALACGCPAALSQTIRRAPTVPST